MTIAEAKAKVVATARSQVGYQEGPNNYNKYADDPNIIRLYGWCPQNQPWCGTFSNWVYMTVLGYDIGSRLTYGGSAACNSAAQLFKNNGAFVYMPEIGDQAFFNVSGGINHTGIVVGVGGGMFTTVEGNYSDKVSLVQHSIGKADVAGFGRPCWEIVEGANVPSAAPSETQARSVLRKGMQGEDVKELQKQLNSLGYDTGGIDGDFGNKTFQAVVAFQEDHGLAVDGVAGPKTKEILAKACEYNGEDLAEKPVDSMHDFFLREVKTGDNGNEVFILQAALNLWNFGCGKTDGAFGPKTQAALNAFKEYKGMKPDGKADRDTWTLLLMWQWSK